MPVPVGSGEIEIIYDGGSRNDTVVASTVTDTIAKVQSVTVVDVDHIGRHRPGLWMADRQSARNDSRQADLRPLSPVRPRQQMSPRAERSRSRSRRPTNSRHEEVVALSRKFPALSKRGRNPAYQVREMKSSEAGHRRKQLRKNLQLPPPHTASRN